MKNQIISKVSTILVIAIFTLLPITSLLSQNYTCKFIGEISLVSIQEGALYGCLRSANPKVCAIAYAAQSCGESLACEGVVKEITEKGCNYIIEAVDDKIKIIGEATDEMSHQLKTTWEALNTVEGIQWLEKSILGY